MIGSDRLEAGMQLLTKPFAMDHLARLIQEMSLDPEAATTCPEVATT